MTDFNLARKNMVDCQLLTNGIVDANIVEAFTDVPREFFLPEHLQSSAYLDEDIKLDNGRHLLEPVTHARMLQILAPLTIETALVLGDYSGYGAAILSKLASTVVTIEENLGDFDRARTVWDELDCCNIAVISGKSENGECEHAPYDLIVLHGAVSSVPEALLAQLQVNGRLVCILRKDAQQTGKICLYKKLDDGSCTRQFHFDALSPFLCGFEPEEAFVF